MTSLWSDGQELGGSQTFQDSVTQIKMLSIGVIVKITNHSTQTFHYFHSMIVKFSFLFEAQYGLASDLKIYSVCSQNSGFDKGSAHA